jgi:hypothetical protein
MAFTTASSRGDGTVGPLSPLPYQVRHGYGVSSTHHGEVRGCRRADNSTSATPSGVAADAPPPGAFSRLDVPQIRSCPLNMKVFDGEEGTGGFELMTGIGIRGGQPGSGARLRRSVAVDHPFESLVSPKGEARSYACRRRIVAEGATRSDGEGPQERPPPEKTGMEGFRLKYFRARDFWGTAPRIASSTEPSPSRYQVIDMLPHAGLSQRRYAYKGAPLIAQTTRGGYGRFLHDHIGV